MRNPAGLAAVAAGVLFLPVLLVVAVLGGGDDDEDCATGAVTTEQQALILATIRTRESGNDYTAINRGDGQGGIASGAYQFVTGTWNNYGGYRDAYQAPPDIQDQRAIAYLDDALTAATAQGLDWTYVPVYWYQGHIPDNLDYIPSPGEGNTATLAEYRNGWLADYQRLADGGIDTVGGLCANGVIGDPIDAPGGVALPLTGQPRTQYTSGHHDYGAIDIMIPTGQTVYAVHGGQVSNITRFDGNCNTVKGDCPASCGNGVTVTDMVWPDITWTYCHLSALAVSDGQAVAAGTPLGLSGNTGRSGGPHLHLEIRVDHAKGSRRCPQALLLQIYDRPGTMIDPHQLPTQGCY